jgi:hypothetical protein
VLKPRLIMESWDVLLYMQMACDPLAVFGNLAG